MVSAAHVLARLAYAGLHTVPVITERDTINDITRTMNHFAHVGAVAAYFNRIIYHIGLIVKIGNRRRARVFENLCQSCLNATELERRLFGDWRGQRIFFFFVGLLLRIFEIKLGNEVTTLLASLMMIGPLARRPAILKAIAIR